jgi:small subunit ribosomal protein S6
VVAYEILLMLDPELPEERQSEIVARTRELIERGGGRWQNQQIWGRRKLAYEIDKKTDGIYHLLLFEATAETLDELTRILKITDGVMRHLAVRQIAGAPPSQPPPQSVPEPEYAANTRSQEEES